MSASREPLSAAEIAAGQVAAIVTAAEQAANDIAANAEREAREREREAEREVKKIREDAEGKLGKLREDAQAEAIKINEIARKEADERIARAQQAADQALDEAQAISAGLRQLGASLEGQAERILRDVQTGHRRIMDELRVDPVRREEPRGGADEPPRPRRSGAGNPLADIEPPSWVGREP
jgi:Skp family chaperone for outer membrane proteins